MNELYAILSVVIVSLISVIVASPFLIKRKVPDKILIILLSFSVGSLLGAVIFHFMPEIISEGYTTTTGLTIIIGFFTVFIFENELHRHHNKKSEKNKGHKHAYSLAPINLVGDGIHNLLDGIIIGATYAASIPLGIATTLSVVFHEIPQEIADFGIFLYSGLSMKKAVFFNFLSATTAIIGAAIGLLFANSTAWFTSLMVPFAAGNFLYIAATNLLPELHKHCKTRETIIHLLAIFSGVFLMMIVAALET